MTNRCSCDMEITFEAHGLSLDAFNRPGYMLCECLSWQQTVQTNNKRIYPCLLSSLPKNIKMSNIYKKNFKRICSIRLPRMFSVVVFYILDSILSWPRFTQILHFLRLKVKVIWRSRSKFNWSLYKQNLLQNTERCYKF